MTQPGGRSASAGLVGLTPGMNSKRRHGLAWGASRSGGPPLSGCLANVNPCGTPVQGVKTSWRRLQPTALARRRSPVPGETRQTPQISAETVNPLTQHEEGEGTN